MARKKRSRKRVTQRQREYDVKYRKDHPAMYKQSRKIYRERQLGLINTWYEEYQKTMMCSVCGDKREPVLDFHHTDPSTKVMEVKRLMRGHHPFEKLMEEVAKCIILCANCHRMHHWEERQRKKLNPNNGDTE